MKKFWKALGIAALAAVVPVRVKTDEESGKKTFQSLLWKLDVGPAADDETTEIGLDLMEGVLTAPLMKAVTRKKEAELFTDDPAEAAVPEDLAGAVLLEAEGPAETEEPAAEAQAAEADFDPEF